MANAIVNCHFSGKTGAHAETVPATKLVQIGSDREPGMTFIHVCQNCAQRLVDTRNDQLEQKRQRQLAPNSYIMSVYVCNLVKTEALEHAAKNHGTGLVAREKACAFTQEDDTACTNPLSGMAIAFGGKVYQLCRSCMVAAQVASNKTSIAELNPVRLDLAIIRAKRQEQERADRKARQKAEHKAKSEPKAPAAPKTPSPFALAVTATVHTPNRKKGPEDLVIGRHLGEHAA